MISYYRAPYSQRGHGLGGIFRGLARFITPIAQGVQKIASNPTVQGLAKEAMKTGVSIAADAIQGKETNAKEKGAKLLRHARDKVAETVRRAANISDEESEDSDYEKTVFKKKLHGKRRPSSNTNFKNKKQRKSIFDH